MKKLLYSCALAALTYFATSCASNNEVAPDALVQTTPPKTIDYSTMKSYLISYYGFKDLVETDESFIAEGDIAFAKKDHELYSYPAANARHYQYVGGAITKAKVVNVRISSNVSDDWEKAVKAAISKWNSLDGKIQFRFRTEKYDNEIIVRAKKLGKTRVVAQAYYPGGGLPSSEGIEINSEFIYKDGFPYAKMVETMVHEMGHILGLGHTDNDTSSTSYLSLSGCSGKDPESVMQPTIVEGWNGFSSCDKKAFAKLY